MNRSRTYKFRAECLMDVTRLMQLMHSIMTPYRITIEREGMFPDCVVEITSPLDIEYIKTLMKEVPDSHVMYQTIEIKSKYTGERRV